MRTEISFRTNITCPAPKVGKDLWINYNPYNLPNSINNSADSYITITYTADGEKLTKVAGGTTRNYVAGIEYLGANLDAIYHTEGRCTPNGATLFHYEYTLKDHLGNARVNFRANGTAVTFLEELHYYPFGMLMEGISTTPVTVNAYKYNGKEINMDLGLNWSDYGARWYDASVGRWWSVDPMADKYALYSPYNYVLCNPIKLIDPDGKQVGVDTIAGGGKDGRDLIQITVTGKILNFSSKTDMDMIDILTYLTEGVEKIYQGEDIEGYDYKMDFNFQVVDNMNEVNDSDHLIVFADLIEARGVDAYGSSNLFGGKVMFVNAGRFEKNPFWAPDGSKTVAHELGHLLNLKHVTGGWNVFNLMGSASKVLIV